MKIFISWSGELSERIAQCLYDWLPNVIQNLKPYFTPEDLRHGSRWLNELTTHLENCSFGIGLVTPESLESHWLHFEAGAITKSMNTSSFIPLVFKLPLSEVTGPLTQFQSTQYSKSAMFKVMRSINAANTDNLLTPDFLTNAFETWWPKLDEKIQSHLNDTAADTNTTSHRPQKDILEELLTRVRHIESQTGSAQPSNPHPIDPKAILQLTNTIHTIYTALEDGPIRLSNTPYNEIIDPLRNIVVNTSMSPPIKDKCIKDVTAISQLIKEDIPF